MGGTRIDVADILFVLHEGVRCVIPQVFKARHEVCDQTFPAVEAQLFEDIGQCQLLEQLKLVFQHLPDRAYNGVVHLVAHTENEDPFT